MRGRLGGDLLGGAGGDHHAALLSALGPHVDEAVGALDDVEVVLDHDDAVAGVHQPLQHLQQSLHVGEVQAGRGLVEDVERAAGGRPCESSVASLTRCASPPESVVAGWPRRM